MCNQNKVRPPLLLCGPTLFKSRAFVLLLTCYLPPRPPPTHCLFWEERILTPLMSLYSVFPLEVGLTAAAHSLFPSRSLVASLVPRKSTVGATEVNPLHAVFFPVLQAVFLLFSPPGSSTLVMVPFFLPLAMNLQT